MTNTLPASNLNSVSPSLKVCSPDDEQSIVCLKSLIQSSGSQSRITVGRHEDNDVVLVDRYKMVSRWQFTLEYCNGRWWISDEDSANGTFVKKLNSNSEIDVRMEELVPLRNGDEILVVGKWTESDQPVFWRLFFCDLDETIPVQQMQHPGNLEYSLTSQQLFKVSRRERENIQLSNQERSLIHHMALKNRENKEQSILCIYEDLITAIWGNSFGHNSNEVSRLVWAIRHKVELDSGEPIFLRTVRGRGYILNVDLVN